MGYMFNEGSSLKELDVSSFKTRNLELVISMFSGCTSLEELKISFLDDNINDMCSLFIGYFWLKKLNLSRLKTKKVYDIDDMFNGCTFFEYIDLSNFNTENFDSMNDMFSQSLSLKEIKQRFNIGNVNYMIQIIYNCSSLKRLNLANFYPENVINLERMFYGCSSLEELYIFKIDITSIESMQVLFYGCSSLKEITISDFNTHNIKNMKNMFYGCSSTKELDIINFENSKLLI